MNSVKVLGKRIVTIEQQECRDISGVLVRNLLRIYLDDGTFIAFSTVRGLDETFVVATVHDKAKGAPK